MRKDQILEAKSFQNEEKHRTKEREEKVKLKLKKSNIVKKRIISKKKSLTTIKK